MTLTLYCSPASCSLAPHIALEEIGAPFSLVLVDTDHGAARTPEFRRINSKGRVPIFVAKDFLLKEAPAILLYLATSYSGAGLLSDSSTRLVRTVEWFNWLSGSVHAVAVRMIWQPYEFTTDTSDTAAVVAKGKELLAESLEAIDGKMRTSEWAVDEQYSVVDIFLLVFYRSGNRMKINMKADYPAWTMHTQRILQRAAVSRALAHENISVWQ